LPNSFFIRFASKNEAFIKQKKLENKLLIYSISRDNNGAR